MEKVKSAKNLIHEYMLTVGKNIKEQREIVFNEDRISFSKRISDVLGHSISPEVLDLIEDGKGSVPLNIYMGIFIIMEIDTALISTTKNNTLLYLAAVESPPNIEKEMKMFLKEESLKKDHG